jgi:Cu(I)/Ag(I) efflux system membrane protein CusA/SilA
MVGGMVSATVLTLTVFPAVYALVKEIPIRHSLKTRRIQL